jgi:hypothetical protein
VTTIAKVLAIRSTEGAVVDLDTQYTTLYRITMRTARLYARARKHSDYCGLRCTYTPCKDDGVRVSRVADGPPFDRDHSIALSA